MLTAQRSVWTALGCLSVVLPLAACAGGGGGGGGGGTTQRVKFVSEPPGATVSIIDASNGRTVKSGVTPFEQRLRFPNFSTRYTIEASPAEASRETHQKTTIEIDGQAIESSESSGATKVYTVALAEREFIDMPFYEMVLVPEEGWKAFKTEQRAFDALIEDDGSVPQRLDGNFVKDDWNGFRGIDISSDPERGRMTYALFTVKEKQAPAPAAAPAGSGAEPAPAPIDPVEEATYDIDETQVFIRQLRGTAVGTVTKRDDELQFDPSPDASAESLYYTSDRQRPRLGYTDCFARSTAGGSAVKFTTPNLSDGYAFRPSVGANERMVFSFAPWEWETLADTRVFTREGAGGFNEDVLSGIHPRVSPNGERVAFVRGGELFVANVDGSEEYQLTENAEGVMERYRATLENVDDQERFDRFEADKLFSAKSHPNWTPDSKWVVFTAYTPQESYDQRPQQDVWIVDADGNLPPQQITTNGSADCYPMVHPSGEWIYFVSNRGKRWGIWFVKNPVFGSEG